MPIERRWSAWLAAALLLVSAACAPANERPVRGAVPGSEPPTPPGVPPTLTSSDTQRLRALATPSPAAGQQPQPSPGLVASPAASPSAVAAPPIVRTIVPANGGHVPAGAPV